MFCCGCLFINNDDDDNDHGDGDDYDDDDFHIVNQAKMANHKVTYSHLRSTISFHTSTY